MIDVAALAESCTRLSGDLVKSLDTTTVAKDFEAARKAVGDEKISYAGFSWGTAIGATYAELFPDKIRALILDGVVDWSVLNPVTLDGIYSGAENTEALMNNFIEWAEHDDDSKLKGLDTARVLQEIFDLANDIRAHPKCKYEAELDDGYKTLLRLNLALQSVHTSGSLPDTLDMLVQALNIKDKLKSLRKRNFCDWEEPWQPPQPADESEGSPAANVAYFCSGWAFPSDQQPDYQQFQERVRSLTERAPHTHAAREILLMSTCLGWPYVSPTRPHRLHFAQDPPPILIVNALWDPNTGYGWAKSVHEQIPGSYLLARNGTGHITYDADLSVQSEARQIMDDYLVHLKLPAAGLVVPN